MALGHALTGQLLEPPAAGEGASGPLSADQMVQALAAAGWDVERLVAHRRQRQTERQPWPHPVPDGLVSAWGQFHSLLQQVRRDLGLDGLQQTVPEGARVLGPAERRLLADKPPHHV